MNPALSAPLDVKLMNLTASVLFMGCALFVLAAGAWWVMRHPGFSIARIVVQGDLMHNNAVTLRANVAPHLVGNFFSVDLRSAREAFEQVPWVRHAQVRRQFPGTLRVELQEHVAVAYWGSESGSAMVNQQGEVFEANVGDVEQDDLPRLKGPQGRSMEVLQMHALLRPALVPLGLDVETFELTGRGSWRVHFDGGAVVELGSAEPQELLARTQRFVKTLTQVAASYGRRPDALESADLRHVGGYALRLRGVATVSAEAAAKAAKSNEKRSAMAPAPAVQPSRHQ